MMLSRPIRFLFVAASLALFASSGSAQKVNNKYRSFPAVGVEFKSLKELSDVPVNPNMAEKAVVALWELEKAEFIKTTEGERIPFSSYGLSVLYIEPEGPTTGGKKELIRHKDKRNGAADYVKSLDRGKLGEQELETKDSEIKLSKGIVAQRSEIVCNLQVFYGRKEPYTLETVYDVYTIQIGASKMIFVWDYPAAKKARKKWSSAVKKSMKTFRFMKGGAETINIAEVDSESSYEDLLAFHRNDVAQTPGWRLVETPSKQYLIKTNSDDDKDIAEVIKRLEASRKLYEKDFPPPAPITSISVVRVCDTESEFHTYGETGGGVAGWFNSGSEELVLYFSETGKSGTLSVMAHEGFHQYCHFLFDRAKAHRWFDEGHGDYYGAWTMKGKKLIQKKDMKGGFARIPELKTMIRQETIKPLSEHIRFTHREWQGQGPSNVSCYAQSFGLISYLRSGAKGKVKGRLWKKEYATILPNYMATLHEGYQAAYAEIREGAQKTLDAQKKQPIDDQDPNIKADAKKRLKSPWDFVHSKASDLRVAAMEASWGKIDEAQFERDWLAWIKKEF